MSMDNEHNHDFLGLEETLEEEDYALIMSKDGTLKGIWIPSGSEDDDIPTAITDVIQNFWGFDPNNETNYGTIH